MVIGQFFREASVLVNPIDPSKSFQRWIRLANTRSLSVIKSHYADQIRAKHRQRGDALVV